MGFRTDVPYFEEASSVDDDRADTARTLDSCEHPLQRQERGKASSVKTPFKDQTNCI